jgi:hypothetical protein
MSVTVVITSPIPGTAATPSPSNTIFVVAQVTPTGGSAVLGVAAATYAHQGTPPAFPMASGAYTQLGPTGVPNTYAGAVPCSSAPFSLLVDGVYYDPPPPMPPAPLPMNYVRAVADYP